MGDLVVMIGTPLEAEHVARLRAVCPRVTVLYEPDLLPATRYDQDHKGVEMGRSAAQERRWREMLSAAQVLWDLPAEGDVPFLGRLRWVQTTSTGVGPAVARLGLAPDVVITTARGVHAGPLAEFVFMALLAHFRELPRLLAEQAARRWERTCYTEVAGRTLVTIGAGDLARGCANLARALGMRVVAVAREPSKRRAHGDLFDAVIPVSQMHAALAGADAVVVTVPHTPATENMIDAAAFAAMRPGVAFVNIGRGAVVDEDALVAALRSGQVGFAALDVAREEPLPGDHPLWSAPNVLISPHSASTVSTENRKIVDIFVGNLALWCAGREAEMRNILDTKLMY